jgi:hypothetical protein
MPALVNFVLLERRKTAASEMSASRSLHKLRASHRIRRRPKLAADAAAVPTDESNIQPRLLSTSGKEQHKGQSLRRRASMNHKQMPSTVGT